MEICGQFMIIYVKNNSVEFREAPAVPVKALSARLK
jgi:hypothetical protein